MTNSEIFLFKLAIELNYRTVADLKETMSQRELMQWYEFYKLHPFHADRMELQMAVLTDILLKVNGNKDSKPLDFMITATKEEKEKQKQKEIKNLLNAF